MKLCEKENLGNIQLPYEKCIANGAASLTDTELLAVLLRCGAAGTNVLELAKNIFDKFCYKGHLGALYNVSYEELTNIYGVGKVKAVQLLCNIEFAKRMNMNPLSDNVIFDSPQKVSQYFMSEMRLLETEHVYLLLLDSKNSLIKKILLSTGSVKSSILEPREVFIHAVRHNAVNILLIHNHPSGNPNPSQADIGITRRIAHAGKMMEILLIDHIIIGDNKFVSLKQEGLI